MINIKNFRSIQDQSFFIEEITTFVGNNDAGKSNVLRALNLFFNGETDHKLQYNFKSDFKIDARVEKNKAKEIVIELGLKLPSSYRKGTIPDSVIWRKVWRSNGEHKDGESIILCSIHNQRIKNKTDLPPRSKIPSLLHNINFIYVPAIKDKDFFIELQGKIYDVLAQKSEKDLHESAKLFETSIQKEFNDLLHTIDKTFSSTNSITLPQNLRGIFENLEFSSNKIPLARRGDGIKVRHIPAMLKFIGDKSSSGHKELIKPQIWGFEEPENNIEYLACFALTEELIEAAKDRIQLIITTHSPAIYNLSDRAKANSKLKTSIFYVEKPQNGSTTLTTINNDELHQKMGFMPLIAPIIADKQKEWVSERKEMSRLITQYEHKLSHENKHRIFVEGETDKRILEKAIEAFAPQLKNITHFELSANNNANAASDKAIAFILAEKHDNNLKGFLVLDDDDEGKKCKEKVKPHQRDGRSNLRVETLTPPKRITDLKRNGFNIDATLESLLPYCLWELAREKGWLVKRLPSDIFMDYMKDKIINGIVDRDKHINAHVSPQSKLLIDYSFTKEGKVALSKHIFKIDTEQILHNNYFADFKQLIEQINTFFNKP